MAHLCVQFRNVPPQAAEDVHVFHCVFYFNLHHIVDKVFIAGTLRTGKKQLYRLPVPADIIHHPVNAVRGFHAHVVRLLFFRQFCEGSLGFHKLSHESGGMRLHD